LKRIFVFEVFVILMFCNTSKLYSQDERVWFNPGVKCGYTFGDNGGFTWGYEMSITYQQTRTFGYKNYPYYIGVVLDIDFCKDMTKIHLGAELASLAGLCIGPTWITENGKTDLGFSITPYTGLFLYPYYSFTYRSEKPNIHEIGGYLKLPITNYYTIEVP
jgi:hypothetical protein